MTTPLFTAPLYRPLLWGGSLFLLALVLAGLFLNAYPTAPAQLDFSTFYASARACQQGLSLYHPYSYDLPTGTVSFDPAALGLSPNLNLPLFTLLVIPLTLLPLTGAYYLWCLVQVPLALASLWALLKELGVRHPLARPFSLLLLCLYFPVLAGLLVGQIGLLLFALLTLCCLALLRGEDNRAGVWLGLALLLKPFTGLLVVVLLLLRRWPAVLVSALVWLAGLGLSLLIFGLDEHARWLTALQTIKTGGMSWNASLEGVAQRYFGAGPLPSLYPSPLLVFCLRSGAVLFTFVGLLFLTRRVRGFTAVEALKLAFALALPLMLLLSPLGWIYYFPLLALAFLLLWPLLPSLRARALLLLSAAASGFPQLLTNSANFRPSLWHTHVMSYALVPEGEALTLKPAEVFHWPLLPEIGTLALLGFTACALLALAQAKSTHTGA